MHDAFFLLQFPLQFLLHSHCNQLQLECNIITWICMRRGNFDFASYTGLINKHSVAFIVCSKPLGLSCWNASWFPNAIWSCSASLTNIAVEIATKIASKIACVNGPLNSLFSNHFTLLLQLPVNNVLGTTIKIFIRVANAQRTRFAAISADHLGHKGRNVSYPCLYNVHTSWGEILFTTSLSTQSTMCCCCVFRWKASISVW